MWQNAHDAYREERILSADPVELVGLAYRAAIDCVREARRHLAGGDIRARGRSITKASRILIELTANLDRERGGEIASRLGKLYGYMLGRLTEAHCSQTDAPLVEVLQLLATLAERWDGVVAQLRAQKEVAATPWPSAAICDAQAGEPARAWSF